jgi:hypothetical protein
LKLFHPTRQRPLILTIIPNYPKELLSCAIKTSKIDHIKVYTIWVGDTSGNLIEIPDYRVPMPEYKMPMPKEFIPLFTSGTETKALAYVEYQTRA